MTRTIQERVDRSDHAFYALSSLDRPQPVCCGRYALGSDVEAMQFSETDLESLSDERLVRLIRDGAPNEAKICREELFGRYYPRVAGWSMKWTRNRDEALDLTQEVFLRVQQKLETFRGQSKFSTWLYTITRRSAINRGVAMQRKAAVSLEQESVPDPVDPEMSAVDKVAEREIAQQLRQAMDRDLDPLEARILYLHHVDGMTLPAITALLGLQNKSGAKAYIVSGKRKLHRRFGKWLRIQNPSSGGALRAVL